MNIILLGYMGSGKSSVAKQLSIKIEKTYLDLDAEIEKIEKNTISEIFEQKGEIYFRKKEFEVLKHIIATKKYFVLSLGGGTPCYSDVMDFLKEQEHCITIYLDTNNIVLTHRLFKEKEQRPLISHLETKELLNEFIRKHLFERAHYYNQAAIKIKVEEKTVDEILEEILLQLF
ncbi:shikimate kinase [Patiriisocius sp. Uisw_017]|jgi:shikimate kinase|uniref:shikimate kinase n=1 Tax=Patiriisocius sp. Uisw_017 TaxID=3230968 RepID=UPI0039EA8EBF